jgi:hypothetical protein
MITIVDEAAIYHTLFENDIKVTLLHHFTTTDSPVTVLPLMAMSS